MSAAVAKAIQDAQVEQLLVEHSSQRSIVRAMGVARMTIAKRPQRQKHLNSMKWGPLWAVARVKAGRDWPRAASWPGCWAVGAPRWPDAYGRRCQRHCRYHTDQWEACAKGLLACHHRPRPKSSVNTSIVEAINCWLRHRCGVLVRKSCSFSKSLAMHAACVKIVIDKLTLN